MNIKHSIGLNLSADAIPGRLHMVQGDSNSRTIVATLWDGAQLYSIPAGAAVMVRFRKPDGTGGLYDATESGSKVSYVGSIVTAPVATQMLAVAGDVFAEIDIFGGDDGAAAERLATFRFIVEVAPCVLPDAEIISSDYYNVLAADIADAKAAADLAKGYAAAAKQSADNAATSVEGAVKYNAPQTLTDAQKQQARDNINVPTPYTAGENISISGSVIATKAFPCNPNLLDNWYLGNPVNQRGGKIIQQGVNIYTDSTLETLIGPASYACPVVELTSTYAKVQEPKNTSSYYYAAPGDVVQGYTGQGYGIDRFTNDGQGGIVTVGDGLVSFQKTGDYTSPIQYFEHNRVPANQTVTISAIVNDDLFFATGTLEGNIVAVCPGGRLETYRLDSWSVFRFVFTDSGVYRVKAVKLELGPQQTLAHQENGVWVLNEIPDFGEQLRKCQRYCFAWEYGLKQTSCLTVMQCVRPGFLFGLIPTPVTMRNDPVVMGGSLTTFAGKVTSLNNLIACANGIRAIAIIEGTNTSQGQAVGIENADDNGRVIFSADL